MIYLKYLLILDVVITPRNREEPKDLHFITEIEGPQLVKLN